MNHRTPIADSSAALSASLNEPMARQHLRSALKTWDRDATAAEALIALVLFGGMIAVWSGLFSKTL